MVMTITFGILAGLCFGYYIIMVSYAGIHTAFASVWLAAVICFSVLAFLPPIIIRRQIKIPIWFKAGFTILFCVIIILFLAVEGCIISGMTSKPKENLDYVIVLGAQVRGTRITNSLRKRLEKACEYLDENPDAVVVVSGGQGKGEDLSEAQCMKDYLIEYGISEDRIIMEDKSTNTAENIEFSMKKIKEHSKKEAPQVGVVTNNFHVYRATAICKKSGYEISGIPAKSDKILFVNYMLREFFAVVKYKCSGTI